MRRGKYEAAPEKSSVSLKSYFMSLLCMVLCCAMFMSTTFAWFSIDVTSSANHIQVGTLQVELLHHTDTGVASVTPTYKIFADDVKWGPDHAELAVLTVKNLGDLAFDYQLLLETDAAGCDLKDGASFADVANSFEVYIYRGDAVAATWDLSDPDWQLVGTLAQVIGSKLAVTEGKLENPGEQTTFAMALYMRNDAPDSTMGQKLSIHVKLLANQEGYIEYNYAANGGELTAALAKGGYTKLTADISAPAASTAPYGNLYGFKLDGGVLDGTGNTLSVTGSGETYAIMTSGGTVKDLTIDCGFRAIMLMYAQEDLILERVNLTGSGVGYPVNTGEHGKAVKLIARNSTFGGWASFAGLESALFTDCTFVQGTYWGGSTFDRVVKPYVDTTFEGCSFVQDQYIDLSNLEDGCKVTFQNCTVGGIALTADNWQTLFEEIELPAGKTISDCVVFQ